MSYVNKKTRVFKEAGDVEVKRKKSDGRMKTYQSATDARAWCDSTEDRRQYILELIRQGDGKGLSLGKYIPIEAIIDILLANKNAEIAALRQFIKDHGLTYVEKEKTQPGATAPPMSSTYQSQPIPTKDAGGKDRQGTPAKSPTAGETSAGKPQTAASPTGASAATPAAGAGASAPAAGVTPAGAAVTTPAGAAATTPAGAATTTPAGSAATTPAGAASTTPAGAASTTPTGAGATTPAGAAATTPAGAAAGTPAGAAAKTPAGAAAATPAGAAAGTPAGAAGAAGTLGTSSAPTAGEGVKGQVPDSTLRKPDGGEIPEKLSQIAGRRSEEVLSGDETDDTIKPSDVADVSGRPQKSEAISDKQAAEDLLAGKTPEEQLDLLKNALAEKDAYNKNLCDLLEAAISQLENIKDIVDDKDQGPEKDVSHKVPQNSGKSNNDMNNKLQKLEEITQERDRLKARVQQLEEELLKYSELPKEIEDFKKKTQALDNLQMDRGDLERRLDKMTGLEEEVRLLKKIADQCAQLNGENLGKSKEVDNLRCKCNDVENEKRKLLDKIQHLEREIEIMKVERNCLKCRLEDMARLQRDYEELLKKTQGYDALKAECATYKAKYEELLQLEDECNELRARVEKAENLEKERALLLKEIMDCECCINSQESEIKRLACHIDCLTQDLDQRQDQMKVKVVSMRAHLEKKDDLIAKSEQKLADVQCQLRNSIDGLSCETTCLRNRIEELEKELAHSHSQLAERDNRIMSLKAQLGDCNKLQTQLEEANSEISRLKDAIAAKGDVGGDEHCKKILKQTRCAIKCLVEKMKKYEIGDGSERTQVEDLLKKIRQLEGELEEAKGYVDQMKACGEAIDDNMVSELKDKIRQLEEELKQAYTTIEGLKNGIDTLKPVVQENQSLRKNSLQIQENAKDQITKLEQSNEKLRRDSKNLETLYEGAREAQADNSQTIADLRKQLEDANRRHAGCQDMMKEMEGKLATVVNSGGNAAELLKLKDEITVLHAEIDRLKFELENEKNNSKDLLDKLKNQRKGSKPDDGSGEELRRLREDKDNEIKGLKDEINRLKQELASKIGGDTTGDNSERDELLRQLAAQKKEINDLVNKIKQPTSADDNLTYQELDKKNKENEKLKSIIDDLERQLNELKKSKIDVPQAAPDVQKTINDLAKRLDDAEQRAREAEEALKKCRQEKGDIGKPETEYKQAPPATLGKDDSNSYNDRVRQLEDELAKQKKDCNDMIGSLKQQHERDIKNLQKRNESSISKVQKSQDELVHDMNLKHDGEVSGLKDVIRKSEEKLRRVSEDKKSTNERRDSSSDKKPTGERRGSSSEKKPTGERRGSSSEKRSISERRDSSNERASSGKRDSKSEQQDSDQPKKILTNIVKVKGDKPKGGEEVGGVLRHGPSVDATSQDETIKAPVKSKVAPKPLTKRPEKPKTAKEENVAKKDSIQQELPIEEPKKKSLTIKTIEDICICSKLPSVIPIAVPDDTPRSQPLRAICGPTNLPRQQSNFYPSTPSPQICGISRPQQIPCPHSGLNWQTQMVPVAQPMMSMDDSRLESPIRKIAELENKLLYKQQQTKQKVDLLQTTVEKFKRELELERQKNNDLINRFSNQSKTVASMMMEIDMVRKESTNDKKMLYQLNTTLKTLEQDLDRERGMVRSLNSMLKGSSGVSRESPSGPRQQICGHQGQLKVSRIIPQFHTEVTRKDPDNNKCKHGCFLKRACPDVTAGSRSDRSTGTSDGLEIDE